MDLKDARYMAAQLMHKHKLLPAWGFKWDNAKKRFGQTDCNRKVISLSKSLVAINSEEEVKDTILHEIAHALVGCRWGHGATWKRKAAEIGAKPERYKRSADIKIEYRYHGVCDCGVPHRMHRWRVGYTHRCRKCSGQIRWEVNENGKR